MTSYTKKQLSQYANVSRTTFAKWLKAIEHKLTPLGYHRTMKLLPPQIAQVVIEHYCIDTT